MPGAAAHRWRCSCCGEEFVGLPEALGFASPAGWDELDEVSKAGSYLDSDLCVVARPAEAIARYVVAVLDLPLIHAGGAFRWLMWISVSEPSWKAYCEGFKTGNYPVPGCFGYLCNEIPEMPGCYGLPANLWFQPDGLRPEVELHEGDHKLIKAQRRGIRFRQVERWAAHMHGQA